MIKAEIGKGNNS